MKNFYRNTMESKVESTRSFLQNEVFSIYYAYSFTTIRYSTTCSKAFMIFVCHWKRKPLKLPLYMNLCILVQKNSKQTLLWTLFISFEFQKRKFRYFPCKTPEVDSAYHLFFFWKSFEVELLLLLYRIYSTEGQKKMMVKFHKVNWTNWKALWTFLIECIKNFHPKNLNANFELREAIYSQKYSP